MGPLKIGSVGSSTRLVRAVALRGSHHISLPPPSSSALPSLSPVLYTSKARGRQSGIQQEKSSRVNRGKFLVFLAHFSVKSLAVSLDWSSQKPDPSLSFRIWA